MKKVMEWMKQHKTALQLCGICVAVCAIGVVVGSNAGHNHTHNNSVGENEAIIDDGDGVISDENIDGEDAPVEKVYREQIADYGVIDYATEYELLADDKLNDITMKYQTIATEIQDENSNYAFNKEDCENAYASNIIQYEKIATTEIDNVYENYDEIDFEQIPYGTPVYYFKLNEDGQHEICMTRSNPYMDNALIQKIKDDLNKKESITVQKLVTARIDGVFGNLSTTNHVYNQSGVITDENGRILDTDMLDASSNWDFVFKMLAKDGVDLTLNEGEPIPTNNYATYGLTSDCSGQEELIKSLGLLPEKDIVFTNTVCTIRECDGAVDGYTMEMNDSDICWVYVTIEANVADSDDFVTVTYSIY